MNSKLEETLKNNIYEERAKLFTFLVSHQPSKGVLEYFFVKETQPKAYLDQEVVYDTVFMAGRPLVTGSEKYSIYGVNYEKGQLHDMRHLLESAWESADSKNDWENFEQYAKGNDPDDLIRIRYRDGKHVLRHLDLDRGIHALVKEDGHVFITVANLDYDDVYFTPFTLRVKKS